MTRLLVLIVLLASGCSSAPPAHFVPPPVQANTWVERYQVQRTFNGYELELGIPPLEAVPVVGSFLSHLVVFRWGHSQDIVVPIVRKEGESFALSSRPLRAPTVGAQRWSDLYRVP